MAQHDYVIDNQASASARADLNLLFQAIASNNSGATAPATTIANMIWYDTATDLLKMRNEANSAWITLGTLDQALNTFTAPSVNGKTINTLTAAGGIAYASNTTTLAAIGAGTAGQALLSGGAGAPTWGASGSMTLLGTLATTSGTTVTLSGLDLTSYKFVVAVLKTVSATLDAGIGLQGNGSNAGINMFVTTGVTANGINGVLQINLTTGVFSATSHTATIASPASGVATSYSGNQIVVGTATTSIGFALGGGTFDAGSITIYGVK